MVARLIEIDEGRFRIEGELNLKSVATLARESSRLFPGQGRRAQFQIKQLQRQHSQRETLELDLSGVTRANSAAVALMLDWTARAQAVGSRLRIRHWPESMLRIARFSNLAELFGLSESTEDARARFRASAPPADVRPLVENDG
ncbi:STAS domain-containing protein [Thiorhodovibrio winogradskyi]|uniref:STAS domain-containing protein n=1 Tax=Thiorhodovibrio winogradskyi TaxID=77007 RepID=UPI0038B61BA4